MKELKHESSVVSQHSSGGELEGVLPGFADRAPLEDLAMPVDFAPGNTGSLESPFTLLRDSLREALYSEQPSKRLEVLSRSHAFAQIPVLEALKSTPQDPLWHPEGSAWTHTSMVVDEAALLLAKSPFSFTESEREGVLWGALLHDNGKALTTHRRESDGRIVSPKHEKAGVEPADALLLQFGVRDEVRQVALRVVEYHMAPTLLLREQERGALDERKFDRAVNRLKNKLDPVRLEVLLVAALADRLGRGGAPAGAAKQEFSESFLKAFAS